MTMKKKQDLLISIDGGATKSIIQIFTADGKFLLENKGGPANIASNTQESWFSIKETLDNSLKQLILIKLLPTGQGSPRNQFMNICITSIVTYRFTFQA